ncbi:MAG: RNA polymerase subunit sigma-24, partial [Thermoleophilia bacterium]
EVFGVPPESVDANQRRAARRRNALIARLSQGTVMDAASSPYEEGEEALVMEAVRRLLPGDQEVLRLVAWEELSPHEAAAVIGCSAALFRLRLHRARRRLARALAEVAGARSRRPLPAVGASLRPEAGP